MLCDMEVSKIKYYHKQNFIFPRGICFPCHKYHKNAVAEWKWRQINGVGDTEIGKN